MTKSPRPREAKQPGFIEQIKDQFRVNKVYQARWVWYHTILAIELLIIIFIQIAILAKI